MIRVNLSGVPRRKAAVKAATKSSGPSNLLPILHLLILAAAVATGYYMYMGLKAEQDDLAEQIRLKTEQEQQLTALIKQGQIFEEQKKALENRIRVIDGLRRNQVNPVMVLDMLVSAIDRTKYVWLSSLSQNNATFSMAGTGTSVEVISDLVRNLESTGYFHNIILQRFQDARGNYTFSMTCEFAPPRPESPAGEKGAN